MAWWREAVVYELYVRPFRDADGDGVGDLPGVFEKLGYLTELGVDAVWLTPIHPSPDADVGYDVADHKAVDPRLGTMEDLDRLLRAAHGREMRVLLALVVTTPPSSTRGPAPVDAVTLAGPDAAVPELATG